jgi:hypothetical protein
MTDKSMTATIRLIIPNQNHPKALAIATAAWKSHLPVFLNVRGNCDWRNEWGDVSPMAIRVPGRVHTNIVHVTQAHDLAFWTQGVENLALCEDKDLLEKLAGSQQPWSIVVLTEDRAIDAEHFTKWLNFVTQ